MLYKEFLTVSSRQPRRKIYVKLCYVHTACHGYVDCVAKLLERGAADPDCEDLDVTSACEATGTVRRFTWRSGTSAAVLSSCYSTLVVTSTCATVTATLHWCWVQGVATPTLCRSGVQDKMFFFSLVAFFILVFSSSKERQTRNKRVSKTNK